ncbi:MAG: methyltransferase domain-containing protein [Actinobacteria bacterium]|nr:methyltransferase domain-containing protein [Actinomycetota bacterium]NIS34149.1 methyltransferase domain-containing protein [Actinomycetota bacterium]NIT97271.1 methyltransferase domain-containing protein [Actinomycetota bacterium]NIU20962.1 methyltransferase domain-containing protein [Actinomycetota bacterium]NIU68933.1 methyltransferase domain-containing protein [Actinomycetota bacterium]
MTEPKWDEHADWWQREFTAGADPEYVEQIIPLAREHLGAAGRVLDIGTGEGQIARALAEDGAEVIGLDPTVAQVEVAADRAGGPLYALALAAGLPVRSASVDGVVVCLVFEHVDDLDGAIAEIARVLEPGGRLLLFLNHPLLQTPGSGMIVDHILDPPETYWRVGPYLREAVTVEEVQKGVFVRFVHRPLSRYVNAIVHAGLEIEEMIEPAPPPGFLAKAPEYEHDVVVTTPRLLGLVARRSTGSIGAT